MYDPSHDATAFIDFGTQWTKMVVRRPATAGAAADTITITIPSAVFGDADGSLRTGPEAETAGQARPERRASYPLRRLATGFIALGRERVPVEEAITAVLERARTEASLPADAATAYLLAPPWQSEQYAHTLTAAARAAGFAAAHLIDATTVAAAHLHDNLDHPLDTDHAAMICDIGAGTCAIAIVTNEGRYRTAASEGRNHLGGLALDAALARRLAQTAPPDQRVAWDRLARPARKKDRRAHADLYDQLRQTREHLTSHTEATCRIPIAETDTTVTRTDLEAAIGPLVDEITTQALDVLRRSGIERPRLGGIYLFGGVGATPLVAAKLATLFDLQPVVITAANAPGPAEPDQFPKPALDSTTSSEASTDTPDQPPTPHRRTGTGERLLIAAGRRPARVITAGIAVLAAIVAAAILAGPRPSHDPAPSATGNAATPADASESPSKPPEYIDADGHVIATADPRTARWGDPIAAIDAGAQAITALATIATDTETLLLTAAEDDTAVNTWHAATGTAAGTYTGHSDDVNRILTAALDGRTVAATWDGETTRVWDPADLTEIAVHDEGLYESEPIWAGTVDSTPALAVWEHGILADTIIVQHLVTGVPIMELSVPKSSSYTDDESEHVVIESSSGPLVVSLVDAGISARAFDETADPTEWTPPAHEVTASAAGVVAGNGVLALASADGTITCWDPATASQIGTAAADHTQTIQAVLAPGGDADLLLAYGSSGQVIAFDPATGQAVGAPFAAHPAGMTAWDTGAVDDLAILATGDTAGGVFVWSLRR